MKTINPIVKTWYIAHNGNDIFHCGECEAGSQVSTGQEFLETFESEIAWIARQVELGIEQSTSRVT